MADKLDEALKTIKSLESRVAALETQMKNKKDMKPEHEQAIKAAVKQAADLQAQAKEFATKAQTETRLMALEAQVKTALAMAGGKK